MNTRLNLITKFGLCLILLFTISVVIGCYSIKNLNKSTQTLNQVYVNQLQSVNFARSLQLKIGDNLQQHSSNRKFNENLTSIYEILLEEADVVQDRVRSSEAKEIINHIEIELKKINPQSIDYNDYQTLTNKMRLELEELIEFESAHAFTTVLGQKKLAKKNLVYTYTVNGIGLVLMILITLYIFKLVVIPLRKLTIDIQRFKDGSLDLSLLSPIKQKDEIGKVHAVFRDMAKTLNDNEIALKEMVLKLRDTNLQLNDEVLERKKAQLELEITLQKMIKLSRQAGMFEVASELLHNLGNILNSVNISIDVLGEIVNSSKLKRSIDFLLKNKSNSLKIEDESVKLIFDYLSQLSNIVENETSKTQSEIELLKKKVDNLSLVVQAQHKYAKPKNIIELVNINSIIEESLAINEHILNNHGIEIERNFSQIPDIKTDKYKIMQILVNFIVNAKQALLKGNLLTRKLQVSTEVDSHIKMLKIAFKDNGVGIEKNNLTRIFQQNIAHKNIDTEGFGLHSSANIAEQLGGRIEALSEGLGHGATFICSSSDLIVQLPTFLRYLLG